MIRVTWKDPTDRHFLCTFLDGSGAKTVQVREGDSADLLRAELETEIQQELIKEIVSIERFDYKDWDRRAKLAKDAVLPEPENGESRSFRDAIWTELKAYLIWLFRGKCAYCESAFAVVSSGDVEHFRPKGKVTDLDDAVIDHPGYYWLAYDPTNLMPSCEKCNRAGAKMNRFPLKDETTRARHPDDSLLGERPRLLNPYSPDHDWRHHFRFVTTRSEGVPGVIKPLTPEGEDSIKAYRLQRIDLIKARAKEQLTVMPLIMDAVTRFTPIVEKKKVLEEGKAPYSAALLAEFEEWERKVLGPAKTD